MRALPTFAKIFLYRDVFDMRKGRSYMSALIESEMGENMFDGGLFLFLNRGRDIVRMIYWDHSGIATWSKTLERQKYKWPKSWFLDTSLSVSAEQVNFLLRGFDLESIREHKKLEFSKTV